MAISPAKILVVSPDPAIRNLLSRFLTRQNYQMETAEDGKSAMSVFESFNPDLVILDADLPHANGYPLCQEVQSRTGVFVLMLGSGTHEADRIRAFSVGSDDYINKPFSLGEMGVRVGAILKRQRTVTTGEQQCLTFEKLIIDPLSREVKLDGDLIPLTALEFDLLYFLAKNPDRSMTRSELIQEVWDYEYVGDPRVVNVHIGRIQAKLGFHQIDEDNTLLKQLQRQLKFTNFKVPTPEFAKHTHLLVITDDRGHSEIRLDQASYTIGRDPNCDIPLASESVSWHHAKLVHQYDARFSYFIGNLDRQGQGLQINGNKVRMQLLVHGDEIVFSPTARAAYYRLDKEPGDSADESHIDDSLDDDDLSGGIAPVPRPWKPTPPPLTDEDAIFPDGI